jgi:hypothetical protein
MLKNIFLKIKISKKWYINQIYQAYMFKWLKKKLYHVKFL